MRWAKSHAVVAICFFISIVSQVGAVPPKVVKAVPDNGDIGELVCLAKPRHTYCSKRCDSIRVARVFIFTSCVKCLCSD